MIGQVEEEEAVDLMVVEVTLADGKCTMLHVPSAEKIVKFRFSQAVIGQYTVVTVLKKGEVKTEIPENQGEETSAGQILKKEGHIREVVTEEIHAVMTTDNSRSN